MDGRMRSVPSSECPEYSTAQHSRCSYMRATLDLTRTLHSVFTLNKGRLGYCHHPGVSESHGSWCRGGALKNLSKVWHRPRLIRTEMRQWVPRPCPAKQDPFSCWVGCLWVIFNQLRVEVLPHWVRKYDTILTTNVASHVQDSWGQPWAPRNTWGKRDSWQEHQSWGYPRF